MMVPQNRVSEAAQILLVDDEKLILDLLYKMLECDRYEILTARNGPDALEICRGSHRPIQLLVTDTQMPVMTGYELAEKCSIIYPAMSVLFVSESVPDEPMRAALKVGNRAFLSKPVQPAELRRHARELLTGHGREWQPRRRVPSIRSGGGDQGDYPEAQ